MTLLAKALVRMVLTHVNPLPRVGDKLALWFEPDDAVLIEVAQPCHSFYPGKPALNLRPLAVAAAPCCLRAGVTFLLSLIVEQSYAVPMARYRARDLSCQPCSFPKRFGAGALLNTLQIAFSPPPVALLLAAWISKHSGAF